MIVSNKNNIVNGNNALVPKHSPNPQIEKQRHRDLEKLRKEHLKHNKEKSIAKKVKTIRNIVILFALGIILIYRYCLIYNTEKEIIDVKKSITSINAENESLKISLLKYNNIGSLEEAAVNTLNMIPKSTTSAIYIDLDKNNFKETSGEKNNNDGFVEKLKKILY